MSISQSKIATDGLVLYCDMNNLQKSWAGKPTTNYAHAQNPRIDSSYASYSATSSGTWNAKHSDAIRVYANDSSEITGYVNTGVTDWTNTYHAIWTYDEELKKPVVTMRDIDGNWKAKSFGLSVSTPSQMGLAISSTYTISWLSWTDDTSKCANAGMYSRRASDGAYSFWDGQSNSFGTAFNTKTRTWQRVYATFTVSSVIDINSSWSCYMYGHYGNRGTVKIADVQIEVGVPSRFNNSLTRTNTQSIYDLTGNNIITANNLTYSSDDTYSFNGSSSYLSMPNTSVLNITTGLTIESWVKFDGNSDDFIFEKGDVNTQYSLFSHSTDIVFRTYHAGEGSYHTQNPEKSAVGITNGVWVHIVGSWDGAYKRIFVNGELKNEVAKSGALTTTAQGASVGRFGGSTAGYFFNGYIGKVLVYNRGLTAAEIKQNFNAHRGRYGV